MARGEDRHSTAATLNNFRFPHGFGSSFENARGVSPFAERKDDYLRGCLQRYASFR
jgi:hypothetical protein